MGKHRSVKIAKPESKGVGTSRRGQTSARDTQGRFVRQIEHGIQPTLPEPQRNAAPTSSRAPANPDTSRPPTRSKSEAKPNAQNRPRPGRRRRAGTEMHPDGTATLERVGQPHTERTQPGGVGRGFDGDLPFLRHNLHFQQARRIIEQAPEMLGEALRQMKAMDSWELGLIQRNRARFLRLLFAGGSTSGLKSAAQREQLR
ncbi:hypothetical protein M409DRAFT_26783 [Zasmidium cellare ATCC 36951]|uniref:XPC-binding domain-containing protein n=1 Tax=Zasmidium cellare ATCC 36951 TaxID=1080233 RepID=A0A6A6C9J1_ZASCE|nr:uncharacterized protein M409DRAFT_26783 [Zasmidium cellare ATCC 36951]KAF2162930.1 hypothetical protein M409DRAFT_26783 [Zasmidium cellare ATCC 36951]